MPSFTGGNLSHYDGTSWSEIKIIPYLYLLSIWGSSPTDVYVVGRDETILHYDGLTWSEMNTGAVIGFSAIWGSSSTDVFIVGGYAMIMHYDGDHDDDDILDQDDNCLYQYNPAQEDQDSDNIGDTCDNCPNNPNGLSLGTCVVLLGGIVNGTGGNCSTDGDCEAYETCQLEQSDYNNNGIGDVCDCEGNFDCDEDCDGTDAALFKENFGRSEFDRPCSEVDICNGDIDCDGDVDGGDAAIFRSDFGRSTINTPCPVCTVGECCSY